MYFVVSVSQLPSSVCIYVFGRCFYSQKCVDGMQFLVQSFAENQTHDVGVASAMLLLFELQESTQNQCFSTLLLMFVFYYFNMFCYY